MCFYYNNYKKAQRSDLRGVWLGNGCWFDPFRTIRWNVEISRSIRLEDGSHKTISQDLYWTWKGTWLLREYAQGDEEAHPSQWRVLKDGEHLQWLERNGYREDRLMLQHGKTLQDTEL